MRLTKFVTFVGCALVPILMFGVDASSDDEKSPVLRLAVVAPLSGDFASYGTEIARGVKIALVDLKLRSPDQKITITYEDACLPAAAAAAAKKLVTVDMIQAVVGSYCVVGIAAMAPILNANRVVTFQTSPVPQEIFKEYNYLFSTNVSVEDEARKAADYAYETLHARKAAVMFVTTQWGQGYSEGFKKRFDELGGSTAVSLDSAIGTVDFRSELTRIKSQNPDVIFVAHVGPMLGNVLKQAKQLGVRQQIITADEAEDASVLEAAGASAEGLTFFSPVPAESNETVAHFRSDFLKQFQVAPGVLAANAYDATVIAAQSFAKCGDAPECARDAVRGVSNYRGVSGDFSFRPNGTTNKEFVRKIVSQGEFKEAALQKASTPERVGE